MAAIDLPARTVRLAEGDPLPFDFLVLATGAMHSYFGHDAWAPVAPGLKSIEDALEIRRRILTAFERAERERDPEQQRALLTFVLVGGGPTGVELAGALAEIARSTLAHDFRHIHPESARVFLLEAAPRVLPGYVESPVRGGAAAARAARRRGADRVTRVDRHRRGVESPWATA